MWVGSSDIDLDCMATKGLPDCRHTFQRLNDYRIIFPKNTELVKSFDVPSQVPLKFILS